MAQDWNDTLGLNYIQDFESLKIIEVRENSNVKEKLF